MLIGIVMIPSLLRLLHQSGVVHGAAVMALPSRGDARRRRRSVARKAVALALWDSIFASSLLFALAAWMWLQWLTVD